MTKQRIFRLLVFAIVAGGIILMLNRLTAKQAEEEKKVLPAQVEEIIEKVKDFPEGKEIGPLKEKVFGAFEKLVPEQAEREVEKKVEEIIKEIKSLPEEKIKEIKKEVFCTEVCQETCQEVCEEN